MLQTVKSSSHVQFRSVSFSLYGTEDFHVLVRRKAIAYMRLHAAEFQPFLGDSADWMRYLSDMCIPCTWGDELTLVRV